MYVPTYINGKEVCIKIATVIGTYLRVIIVIVVKWLVQAPAESFQDTLNISEVSLGL